MNLNFNMDAKPNRIKKSEGLAKTPFKSTSEKSELEKVFQYYDIKIVLPDDKSDYIEMLSCIYDIILAPMDLEPWRLLKYLDKKKFEQSEKYIPIKLVDESKLLVEEDGESLNDKKITPDLLGAYFSCDDKNEPIILLYPKKLLEAAERHKIPARLLCKTVIIHEFAHALMDSNNWKSETDFAPRQKNQCQKITSDARRFMEESLANMLTLQYFTEIAENAKKNAENAVKSKNEDLKNAANDLEHDAKEKADEAEKVKEFIDNHQPHIYQFGITQFELKTNWKEWRDYKANKTSDFWSYWAGLFAGKEIVKPKHQ